MWKATWKSVLARKSRLLLSALAIVLGVAFVAGSLMFTNLLSRAFDEIVQSTVGDVNVISDESGFADFTTAIPDPDSLLTEDDVARVAEVDGIAHAEPLISSAQVFLVDTDGQLVALGGAPGIGSNWHETPAAGGLEGVRIVEGRAPEQSGEVVVDPSTVERAGYAIGDEVSVYTPIEGIQTMTLVGTGTYGSGSTAGASYLFFTMSDARDLLLGGADGYQGMWIQTDEGASPDEVATAVDEVLPEGWQASTGEALAQDVEELLDVGMAFVNTFLLVFAAIALLVATLLILNTFSILIAQRARELALLRALGAKRSQVRNSVLTEALIVGVLGSTLGIAVGYGLVWGLLWLMSVSGIGLGDAVPTLTWQAIVASYAVGIVVTLIAALVPSLRASRTRPVEAMADAAAPKPSEGHEVSVIGVVLIEIGVALIVCGAWLAVPQPVIWVGVGAALVLVGAVLAAPTIGAPVIAGLGWVYAKVFGEVGRLAALNSKRQPRRTAATAATLMIGLTLVTTVAVLAASTTDSLRDDLTADQRGDFVITPVTYMPFDSAVVDAAADVEGVEWVAPFRSGEATFEFEQESGTTGGDVTLGATSPRGLAEASSVELLAGELNDHPDSAVVSADFADEHDLSMGMGFDVTGARGTVRLLVTGIADDASGPPGEVTVALDTFSQVADDSLTSSIVVFTADGADQSAVEEGLRDASAEFPTVVTYSVDEYVDVQVGQFEQLVLVLYALLGLALVISVLGIVNTLSLSVIERTKEIGLLRTVGITRGQVRRMVTLESVLITVLGSVLGVLLGLGFGSVLVHVNRDAGLGTLTIPWLQVVLFVVAAAIFGWLAAIGPARRAARLKILEAIARD